MFQRLIGLIRSLLFLNQHLFVRFLLVLQFRKSLFNALFLLVYRLVQLLDFQRHLLTVHLELLNFVFKWWVCDRKLLFFSKKIWHLRLERSVRFLVLRLQLFYRLCKVLDGAVQGLNFALGKLFLLFNFRLQLENLWLVFEQLWVLLLRKLRI